MRARDLPFVDARKFSLDEWLTHMLVPSHQRQFSFEDYRFPTDELLCEYLAGVHRRDEMQIKALLRALLISNGTLGSDARLLEDLAGRQAARLVELTEKVDFMRRLFEDKGPWQGITWVLDLLPSYPARAIEVLEAYFTAHCQVIPDGRADGMGDVKAIIRQRYFHFENSNDALKYLRPADFELLIAELFRHMGYVVAVTQATRDGGIDLIAERTDRGARELAFIQCKRHTNKVTVKTIRELTGVVLKKHANKGFIVTMGAFTGPAEKEAQATATIELIDFSTLNVLLNKHLGSNWPERIAFHIRLAQGRRAECEGD